MTKEYLRRLAEHIPDDEPVFVLRARDFLAPGAISDWMDAARHREVASSKIKAAGKDLAAFAQFQLDHPERCKFPD
jgi:hypothetical protein